MRCIRPDSGWVTVSIDLASGEPSVSAHYSGDFFYRWATVDGVGKDPFYNDSGVLMIDDIYLMVMSVSPLHARIMREAFDTKYDGLSFVEQWWKDADVIKSKLKKHRNLAKMLALAISYGMGPKQMVKQCYDSGYSLDIAAAKAFHRAYWKLFADVKKLADKLAARVERDGFIVNQFGYRLVPEPHKAFNYYVQSSVSGIMHVFNAKLFAIAPYAKFVTVIHDELLVDIPEDKIEEFRRAKDVATESLNKDLGWTVNIRTGYAVGRDWYEAK
jgi:hypothetical protein